MYVKQVKYELQHLIQGKNSASYDTLIQSVANHLRSGKRTGPMAEEKFKNKTKETTSLINYAASKNLLFDNIERKNFISSGAEQRVFIKGQQHVVKLNDAVYYASWEDYFHSLLLHNYFFSDTAYNLLGFHVEDEILFAVVQQPYVKADRITNLEKVREFMTSNGFINIRHHDYQHPQLGLILEDLHDENVLTNGELLYFIDTVFFIEPDQFWN